MYICLLVICSFLRKYKNPMQLYKMIKPARLVQKCFSTSILVQGLPAARLCTKLRWRFPWSTNFSFRRQIYTLHFITYPDVVYKVTTAAIFIQTRGVKCLFSLENSIVDIYDGFLNQFRNRISEFVFIMR